MKTSIALLSIEHRSMARNLWQALYNAPDNDHLLSARHDFDDSPEEVRMAVLRASIQNWRDKTQAELEENPFD
ncbi:MAG: hypothetical protein EOP04_30505 [Proteobacteria bacterium]|nr:MAG: hypothetical protein EOP04_30505 [Pseudomonadota bacterium]